jgi:tRNA (guanosine-2'-O-)-methyltransferase
MNKKELLPKLLTMVSDNKNELFADILCKRTRHLSIVIENMYQEQNASAIVRSADCLGVQDVHIIENNNELKINEDIAMGSDNWMTIKQYYKEENNTLSCLNQLKSEGYKIAVTSPHQDDMLISELSVEDKTALVFGTEMTGVSEIAKKNADVFVKIPMYGFTESYNLSVSAGICMYDFIHRLKSSTTNWELSDTDRDDILFEWLKHTIDRSDKVIEHLISNK